MPSLKPLLYDLEMRLTRRAIDPRRKSLVEGARGRVLELGIGTGQNLRFYAASARVIGVEPDLGMLQRAIPRAADSHAAVEFAVAVGESLPFRDGVFDEVVASLVL